MKLKIAICDDDSAQCTWLTEIISSWVRENRHLAEIKQYTGAEPFLFDYAAEKDFDLLLLDVEMPGLSGIDLAKKIRPENTALQIIFVTGYYEYFSDGFDVSALHYLIKPVDAGKLRPVLDRAADNLTYRQRSVLISTSEEDIKLPLSDILYLEAENVYVLVHTSRDTYRTRISLRKLSGELDETFFKVHRSFIIGLKHVRKITRAGVTMSDGAVVPISRGLYEDVHAALIRYL